MKKEFNGTLNQGLLKCNKPCLNRVEKTFFLNNKTESVAHSYDRSLICKPMVQLKEFYSLEKPFTHADPRTRGDLH